MVEMAPYVGGIAAFLASPSYIPQVRKAWPRESTKDLSTGMLTELKLGLGFWIVYGVLRSDWVIVAANAIGTALTAVVPGCKLRDRR
jgi:MtN3 and saliva related transmembrane protein